MKVDEVIKLLRGMGKPCDEGGWANQEFLDAAAAVEQQNALLESIQRKQEKGVRDASPAVAEDETR